MVRFSHRMEEGSLFKCFFRNPCESLHRAALRNAEIWLLYCAYWTQPSHAVTVGTSPSPGHPCTQYRSTSSYVIHSKWGRVSLPILHQVLEPVEILGTYASSICHCHWAGTRRLATWGETGSWRSSTLELAGRSIRHSSCAWMYLRI